MRVQLTFGIDFGRTGNPIGYMPITERHILYRAAKDFGGATLTSSIGSWIGPDGKLVIENGRVLTIDGIAYQDLCKARAFAAYVKDLLGQESVVLAVFNTEAEFI